MKLLTKNLIGSNKLTKAELEKFGSQNRNFGIAKTQAQIDLERIERMNKLERPGGKFAEKFELDSNTAFELLYFKMRNARNEWVSGYVEDRDRIPANIRESNRGFMWISPQEYHDMQNEKNKEENRVHTTGSFTKNRLRGERSLIKENNTLQKKMKIIS